MRKFALCLVAVALVSAACSKKAETGASASTSVSPSVAQTAQECAQTATLLTSGTLTVGTSEPAYSPYFSGGSTDPNWTVNDPNNGKGFEAAVAYEVAKRMGFTADQVKWVPVKFAQSYAVGEKPFDMNIQQVSYKPKRAEAVDFSDSYYDFNQALVAVKGTPITSATSIADLKSYTLAAPLGTTSYDTITNVIQPTANPGVYQSLADTVAALNAGQVDGIIVDYPTAVYIADPYVQEVKNSVVVGQFENPPGTAPEYMGITLPKGSALTACVNLALAEMKADGTLQDITKTWLSDKTNVGKVPVFTP